MKQGILGKVLILIMWLPSVGAVAESKEAMAGISLDEKSFRFPRLLVRPISFVAAPFPLELGRSQLLTTRDSCQPRALDEGLHPAIDRASTSASGNRMKLEQRRSVSEQIYTSLEEAVADSSRPQLLVFFSLVCHVCWEELFEMKEFVERYSIPVEIVGIAKEPPAELQSFAARYSFAYPIIYDSDKKLYRRFRVKLEPFRVILVKGTILYQDDLDIDYLERRERVKRCLLEIASK